jgi:hypothetical protein
VEAGTIRRHNSHKIERKEISVPNKTLHMLALASGMLVLTLVNASLGAGEIRFMPVAADGNVICLPGEDPCGETEIMLSRGGVEVMLFVELSGWDSDPPHPGDSAYFLGGPQATLDEPTLEGGDASGVDTIRGLDLAVVGAASGTPENGVFIAVSVCGNLTCVGNPFDPGCVWDRLSNCGASGPTDECPAALPFCIERPEFLFDAWGCIPDFPVPMPPYSWFCASPDCKEDPRCDPPNSCRFYLGTLLLEVPSGAQGTYNVSILDDPHFTMLNTCPGPPFPDVTLMPAKITLPAIHSIPKHRYVSINPAAYGPDAAGFRVDLVSLKRCSGNLERACTFDSDCEETFEGSGTCVEHPHVGASWWVQEAQQEPLGCLPDNVCGLDDYFARVGDTPLFTEWTQPWLHIGDCEIIPPATYEIRRCLPPDGIVCYEPLTIGTVAQSFLSPGFRGNFGDIASAPPSAGEPFGPPDGYANVTDYMAVMFTMQKLGTDNQPQAHPTWVDLAGYHDGRPPDYFINVTDLQVIMWALWGHEWTQLGGVFNPGDCP